jgi:pSer/pThr/pTyr-binding forkhead associated (FHA) protein
MNETQTAPHLTVPENVYLLINHQIFLLENPVTRIGRQLENDLVIQDMLVSRQHARISFEREQFVLEDLESTGGTFINGKRVDKSVLNHGDQINIANVVIKFVYGNSEINQESQRRTDSLS